MFQTALQPLLVAICSLASRHICAEPFWPTGLLFAHLQTKPSSSTVMHGRPWHHLMLLPCLRPTAGVSSPLVSTFLPAFCQQLLSGSSIRWTSVCLDLLALLPLTPAAAAEAWKVLLMVAVRLQGPAFTTGELSCK